MRPTLAAPGPRRPTLDRPAARAPPLSLAAVSCRVRPQYAAVAATQALLAGRPNLALLSRSFRGMGNTAAPLKAAAVAAVVNLCLDPLLMFGPLRLGVGGAAGATGAAQTVACLLMVRTLLKISRERSASRASATTADLTATSPAAAGPAADFTADPATDPPTTPASGPVDCPASVDASAEPAVDPHADAAPATSGGGDATLGSMLRTSSASLLRATSIIGCWVFIASSISRQLGPAAIAAHGVVLKVWLLVVLAAEAPAVAGQVLCARAIASGETETARALVGRLLRISAALGAFASALILAIASPASAFFVPADAATAASCRRLFKWAALVTPLVPPTVMCEAVLLGAGRSYRYLAISTLASAVTISALTRVTLAARPVPSSAWALIFLFFSARFTSAARRVFCSAKGGFRLPAATPDGAQPR